MSFNHIVPLGLERIRHGVRSGMSLIQKADGLTKWCAVMVPIVKPSGEVRICVDLTQLNRCVWHERFVLPIVDDVLGQLAGATYFSKLDANSGFHQLKLAKENQELTTFITPFGR